MTLQSNRYYRGGRDGYRYRAVVSGGRLQSYSLRFQSQSACPAPSRKFSRDLQRRWNRAGRPAEASTAAGDLQLADDYTYDFNDCDLIIESAPEHEGTKRRIYNDITTYLKPEALIASNTSSHFDYPAGLGDLPAG